MHNIFHYIDDFVIVGRPDETQCESGLRSLIQACENLGFVVADDKTEGPSTRLTVLGIEFDTEAMVLRLPQEKLERQRSLLATWRGRSSYLRRQLESLAVVLQHASKVVRPGRSFMRRIYDLLAQMQHFKPHFRVRLNSECQADIEWWSTFSQYWNGRSIMRPIQVRNPDVHIWSDASSSWGCGAFWQRLWLQVAWESLPIATASIAPKEFFPILVACAIWGHYWRGCTVCSHCDNTAVVEVINTRKAKDPLLCHQLRALFFASTFLDFELIAAHTPGQENGVADALSLNMLPSFLTQSPMQLT